ncbi:hypothetical protein MC885_014021 [Smutsia gigantea]|nr:hypothetical protein MC885_014021 [Smutsia gigantea]
MLQEESDLSLIIAQIVQKLKGSNLYAQLERQAWASLQRPEIKLESLKEDIKEFFKISGWEKKLQNAVYCELSVFPLPHHPAAPPEHLKEPLVYMRKAQPGPPALEIALLRALHSVLGRSLGLPRPRHLMVLINLRNPNYENGDSPSFRTHLGLIQVPLKVKDIPELDILYYEQLKTNVIQHDLLVDSLIYKDVKLTASNDDYYFVFEDYLYQVLLCFSRDTSVLGHFAYNSASPPKSYIRGKLGLEEYAVFYPPNGVIPFHGFSMYGYCVTLFAV